MDDDDDFDGIELEGDLEGMDDDLNIPVGLPSQDFSAPAKFKTEVVEPPPPVPPSAFLAPPALRPPSSASPISPTRALPIAPTSSHKPKAAPAVLLSQPAAKAHAVDPSLFSSSSLRRLERNPAESPLKRTKVSEEDDSLLPFTPPGTPFPATPMGRPRIPGPAGELSVMSSAKKKGGLSVVGTKSSQGERVPSPIITRGSEQCPVSPTDPAQDVDFYNGPWLTMLEQLQLPPFTPPEGNALRFKFSIEHVLRDGWRSKVPQLVVVIKSIATDSNASVTVKDPTGEMQGTIHYSALDNHPNLIKRGAVLFLRQVSVFTPVPGSHYLNVTDANIVHIFPHGLPHPAALVHTKSWRHTFSPLEAYEGRLVPPRATRGSAAQPTSGGLGTGLAPSRQPAAATTPYAAPKAPGHAQASGSGGASPLPGAARPSQTYVPRAPVQVARQMPGSGAPLPADRRPRGEAAVLPRAPQQQQARPPVRREELPTSTPTAEQPPLDDMDLIYASLDVASLLHAP